MASNLIQATVSSGDLVDLVSSSGSAKIYPNDDAIISVLHARFRADLPYTSIGSSNIVVVNPYKTLANVNDASAKEYEERCYKDTTLPMVDSPKPLQPHMYELAAKVYLLMRRREESQALITRSVSFYFGQFSLPTKFSEALQVQESQPVHVYSSTRSSDFLPTRERNPNLQSRSKHFVPSLTLLATRKLF